MLLKHTSFSNELTKFGIKRYTHFIDYIYFVDKFGTNYKFDTSINQNIEQLQEINNTK